MAFNEKISTEKGVQQREMQMVSPCKELRIYCKIRWTFYEEEKHLYYQTDNLRRTKIAIQTHTHTHTQPFIFPETKVNCEEIKKVYSRFSAN
jgi:hypothetical protein